MQVSHTSEAPIIVIGAGIAGLACAARLAEAGLDVLVLERHETPGGKIRTVPTLAGPADTGPTVLTMRAVFDDLFATLGESLDAHLTLHKQTVLARHFWPDGGQLDLFDNEDQSAAAIGDFSGRRSEEQFRAFCARTRRLFDGFDAPMMQSARPRQSALVAHVARNPHLIRDMAPTKSLAALLNDSFDDPKLRQLFGRYATYVGGSPYLSPALLSLIWQAEANGVWVVEGGMHKLAQKLEELGRQRGARYRYNAHVARIHTDGERASAVELQDGTQLNAAAIVFNGDPRALATGRLGDACRGVAMSTRRDPRSLSAEVWAFAATPHGPDLAHHNVFFRAVPKPEFDALAQGRHAEAPTLYICAQDRGMGHTPLDLERFEIIANAPALKDAGAPGREFATCHNRVFGTLETFGLTFSPMPDSAALSQPSTYEQHASESILNDHISTSRSRPMAMPGGMSTDSATAVVAQSVSSRS